MQFFRKLADYRLILGFLIRDNIVLKYKKTALGLVWAVFSPLLHLVTLAFVFSTILGRDLRTHTLHILSGLVPWQFFAGSLTRSTTSLVVREGLIKKIYVPKQVFVFADAISMGIESFISLVVLYLLVTLFVGFPSNVAFLLLVPIFLLQLFFHLGLALLFSVVNVFFRDTANILQVILQLGFFATPILYTADRIPASFQFVLWINPMYWFIDLYRSVISRSAAPGGMEMLVCCGITAVAVIAGTAVFKAMDKKIVFML
jgi:ABC-type polysaccharide/polyol phosphate export permease